MVKQTLGVPHQVEYIFVKRSNRNGSAKLEKKMKVLISENSTSAEGGHLLDDSHDWRLVISQMKESVSN